MPQFCLRDHYNRTGQRDRAPNLPDLILTDLLCERSELQLAESTSMFIVVLLLHGTANSE